MNNSQINQQDNDSKINELDDNYDPNQFDISELGITNEPVNKLANRVLHYFVNRYKECKQNYENNESKTKNEEECIKLIKELFEENIQSLDQLNSSINENLELTNQLNLLFNENSNLKDELCDVFYKLNLEKESNNNLRTKFEEDEQQNQEEHNKKDKEINDLKIKLKKSENEYKLILEDKQIQMIQYQNDLIEKEEEKLQLNNDKKIYEMELMNLKSLLNIMITELCNLFNFAPKYRDKPKLFGKQFIDTFDFVFGKVNLNLSNITFLGDMPSIDEDLNKSILNLKDITPNELNYFNNILKEKLIQNEKLSQFEETFNNSKLSSKNYVNTFQNRLLGNETFKSATITCFNETTVIQQQLNSQIDKQDFDSQIDKQDFDSQIDQQHLDSQIDKQDFDSQIDQQHLDSQIDQQQQQLMPTDYLNILIGDDKVKYLVVKNNMEIDNINQNESNNHQSDQIKFMYKSDKTLLDESFHVETHNRFEESFTKNYAKNCLNNSDYKPESLNFILNLNKDKSLNNSIIESIIKEDDDDNNIEQNFNKYNQNNNLTKVIRKISNQKQPDDSLILNDSFLNGCKNDDLITFNHDSEIKSIVKSSKHINLQSINGDQTKIFNDETTSNSSSDETEIIDNQTDFLLTLSRNLNSRSDGESIEDEYSQTTESLGNSSTVTQNEFVKNLSKSSDNLNELNSNQNKSTAFNLTTKFFEISDNKELNSTVKIDDTHLRSVIESENKNQNSSDMELSEDENLNYEQLNLDDENNFEDSFLAETMLSKTEISYDLENMNSKDDSNYEITNMEITNSSTKSRLSSTRIYNSSRSTISKQESHSSRSSLLSRLSEESVDKAKKINCSLHINSKSRCRRVFKRRKPSWRTVCLVYLDPLFSFLYFFFSLFMKTLFVLVVLLSLISGFLAITVFYHYEAIRIYYTSWSDIGNTIINRIIGNLLKRNHYYYY